LGTTVDTIPAEIPYLKIPEHARHKAAQWAWPEDGMRVGIVWAGCATHSNDRWRSMPPSSFAPLVSRHGAHFYSLQVEKSSQKNMDAIVDLAPAIVDMADTAALIEQLDLVITVDTSVAHLAGALGKPTWILLSRNADWRWGMEASTTPWYPSARLFRQHVLGDWADVVDDVTRALDEFRTSREK